MPGRCEKDFRPAARHDKSPGVAWAEARRHEARNPRTSRDSQRSRGCDPGFRDYPHVLSCASARNPELMLIPPAVLAPEFNKSAFAEPLFFEAPGVPRDSQQHLRLLVADGNDQS